MGFMGGTATIIILQQLKGFFGLVKFTPHTDIISVLHSVFAQTHEVDLLSVLIRIILFFAHIYINSSMIIL